MDLFGKQHAGNLRGRTWVMEEFESYFGQEAKSRGNSAQFQEVAQALAELNRVKEGPETKENRQARLDAGDRLMRACQAYSDSHKDAKSPKGRERLAVIDKLSEFQLGQSLRNAEAVRDREWDLETLGNYFRDHEELKASSPEFQAAARAFEEFAGHRDEVITPESAMAMIKSSDKLKKACQAFSDSQKGTMLASGLEHQAFIDGLSRFHEDLNLDQARDRRILRDYEGKTWGEAGKFKMAEMNLEGKSLNTVGANVNQRFQVDYEGKKGFFTERLELKSQEGYVRDFIEAVDRTQDPGLYRALKEHENDLNERITLIGDMKSGESNLEANRVACCMGEHWNQMEAGITGKKEKLGRELIGDLDTLKKAAGVVMAFQAQVNKDMEETEKSALMEQVIGEKLGEQDRDLKNLLSGNKDFLMGVPAPDRWMSAAEKRDQFFKLALIQAKASDPNAKPLDRLIEDGKAIHQFADAARAADAASTARSNARLNLDEGNELTSRNIASSRMAELLGIGDIIAHSEPMKVKMGGKVMTGCFMEFAKGTDLGSKSERVQRMFDQVEKFETAGLYRDSSTLEVFDFLCGQVDRHGNNMFYQLSEPDENGKRAITGLQGIDSDLAFGDWAEGFNMNGLQSWKDTTFIDAGLAEKVKGLDRDTLEYAIGDLIPQKQIDVMMQRVNLIKDHIEKDMVIVEPDKWDLKANKPEQVKDHKDQRYVDALDRMEKSVGAKSALSVKHKNALVNRAVNSLKTKRKEGPKVALSFKELEGKERRQALRREPKMTIGKDRVLPKKQGPQLGP